MSQTVDLNIPHDPAERERVRTENKPVISIYHQEGRWRVECPMMPDLQLSSVTLWSLLNLMRDRITVDTEVALRGLPARMR